MAETLALENALRGDEEFTNRFLESSRDWVAVLDLDARLLLVNAAGRDALEIGELGPRVGASWLDYWQGTDRATAEQAADAARVGGVGRFVGCCSTARTDRRLWWDVAVTAINGRDGRPERLLACARDVTVWQQSDEILKAITEETASATGVDFFHVLARHLARALRVRYSFVAECTNAEKTQVRTLAFWQDAGFGDNVSYPLRGTPCEGVIGGEVCAYPERVQTLFPDDRELVTLAAEGYIGVPLRDAGGNVLGHLAVLDDRPLHPQANQLAAIKVFASRAGAELERLQAIRAVERANLELQSLVEINRAISRHLNRDELFGALAQCLKTLVPTERFGIELPIEGGRLQGHILSDRPLSGEPTEPTVLPAVGTACDSVLQRQEWYLASSRRELRERFPVTFEVMSGFGMESLVALPLVSGGRSIGALFFMAAAEGAYAHLSRAFLEQVAGAVAVALDNCLAHEQLRRDGIEALAASEERFRDLFDEAPIAYVHEGLDTRFLRANRAAMRALGITPDQVDGTYGSTFVPDTPDAQRRLQEALASVGRGTATSGVVLELRRRNGAPLWIQWWSKPDPSGQFTRTMFVDITERVLMEQEKDRLEAQNAYLKDEIKTAHDFKEIIGTSAAINKTLRAIDKVAATDATVLIMGETGTGKELAARAIHGASHRKDGVLVKVNCAAIPAGLIESELFGHERGAFTGALMRKIGRFELADRGTLFLDEVGEIPLDLQTKLLRVLQEGEFERLGSTKTQRVNVRIIAATNRDLQAEVREGRFRADLYYRLNVFPLVLPALRDRPEDIPLLVSHFLRKHGKAMGRRVESVSPSSMALLERYSWPGNVRELEHVLERGVILSHGPVLEVGDWMPRSTPDSTVEGDDPTTLDDAERRHILKVLEQTGWRVSGDRGAAAILGLKSTTLEARMKRLGIVRPTDGTRGRGVNA
ncbi:MAG: sigma 54-interacting transcriptional regulator [Gemmatimonadales bacterium]